MSKQTGRSAMRRFKKEAHERRVALCKRCGGWVYRGQHHVVDSKGKSAHVICPTEEGDGSNEHR
jgi:hypothetical protein